MHRHITDITISSILQQLVPTTDDTIQESQSKLLRPMMRIVVVGAFDDRVVSDWTSKRAPTDTLIHPSIYNGRAGNSSCG